MKTCTIHTLPTGCIDHELATTLIGLNVTIRLELFEWTSDPTNGADAEYYFVANDEVLTNRDGIEEASRWNPFLPLGRATRIPKACCTVSDVATATEGVTLDARSPHRLHALRRSRNSR